MKGAISTPRRVQRDGSLLSRVLLSSGLTAAMVGLLLSLLGLMYRVGFLAGFGIAPDLFLPESSTELSYWGYMAVIHMWASMYSMLGTRSFWYLVLGGAALGLTWSNVSLALDGKAPGARARLLRRKLRNSRWAQGATGTAVGLFAVSVTPWLIVVLATFVIGFPLEGYKSGKREAERVLVQYKDAVPGQRGACAVLTGLREPASSCLLVIAQSKERMAFADGDRVRVVWSKDVEVSWNSRDAQMPLKTPKPDLGGSSP